MFPVFYDPVAVEIVLSTFFTRIVELGIKIDTVVALDARGFLFGPQIAQRLGARFAPVRKAGKVCCLKY